MKRRRSKANALAVVATLIVVPAAALLTLLNLDWNRAKPWLNARTSEALGRPFVIAGDLSVTWSLPVAGTVKDEQTWHGVIPWPNLLAQDIHIGNPAAMAVVSPADMASIGQVDFSLNP